MDSSTERFDHNGGYYGRIGTIAAGISIKEVFTEIIVDYLERSASAVISGAWQRARARSILP